MRVVDSKNSPRLLSKNDMKVGDVFASVKFGNYWTVCTHLKVHYVLSLETGRLYNFQEFNSASEYYKVSGAFVVEGDLNDS